MTELLERAIERLRAASPEEQDAVAAVMLQLTGEAEGVYVLTPEEEASFGPSLRQSERGEFASDADVEAVWAKYRR